MDVALGGWLGDLKPSAVVTVENPCPLCRIQVIGWLGNSAVELGIIRALDDETSRIVGTSGAGTGFGVAAPGNPAPGCPIAEFCKVEKTISSDVSRFQGPQCVVSFSQK